MNNIFVYRTALGKAIQEIRKNKSMLQADLAVDAELSQNYVSDIENAKVNCSIGTLIRVANALEANPSTLFILTEDLLGKEGSE